MVSCVISVAFCITRDGSICGQIAVVDGEKVLRDSEPGKKLFADSQNTAR